MLQIHLAQRVMHYLKFSRCGIFFFFFFCRILTLEDAYYDNSDYFDASENKYCQKTLEQIEGGKFSHDALGLAVAKMSYNAYPLGQGYD
jgi:hypothetical protein